MKNKKYYLFLWMCKRGNKIESKKQTEYYRNITIILQEDYKKITNKRKQ